MSTKHHDDHMIGLHNHPLALTQQGTTIIAEAKARDFSNREIWDLLDAASQDKQAHNAKAAEPHVAVARQVFEGTGLTRMDQARAQEQQQTKASPAAASADNQSMDGPVSPEVALAAAKSITGSRRGTN